jgi:hypothetical protein
LTDAARAFLAERGYDPGYGARPLARAVKRHVQDPLAQALLEGVVKEGAVEADVNAAGDSLAFRNVPMLLEREDNGGGEAKPAGARNVKNIKGGKRQSL